MMVNLNMNYKTLLIRLYFQDHSNQLSKLLLHIHWINIIHLHDLYSFNPKSHRIYF